MDIDKQKDLFKDIYNKEINRVFRFVFLRISSREEAIDITEDVFYKLWQSMKDGKAIENQPAFLFTIARNKIIDWYRKKKPASLDQMLEVDGDDNRPADIADPDSHSQILISTEVKLVIKALKILNPKDAEIMELRFIEGLQPQEIAERLGTSANNISIRITRAIQKIREELRINIEENGK